MVHILVVTVVLASAGQDGPRMEDVVAAPADFAGRTLTFGGVTLSGSILRYDLAGVRKYYLTVGSRNLTYEPGFFLAPPPLADKLYDRLSPRRNYAVNLTCRVERLVINDVPQWHGIVSRVDLLGDDGSVAETIRVGK
jgi:hypothetical protein